MNYKIYKNNTLYTFILFISISFSIISCIASPPNAEIIVNKNITINDSDRVVIDGKELTSQALNGAFQKLNLKNIPHTFTLHKLPTLVKKSSVKYIQLYLELNGYTDADLNEKDFFLIFSNTNNSTNTNISINNSILPTIVMPDDYTSDTTAQEQVLPSLQSTKNFIETYKDFDSATVGKTKRSMMFSQLKSSKDQIGKYEKTQTTLFKKIEKTIQEKNVRILIWVEDTSAISNKENAQAILTKFEEDFFTSINGTSLYEMLYVFNGENHFWGDHKANNVAKPESALHIGFGKLKTGTGHQALGFINPSQMFTIKINDIKESVIAPTVYLRSNFLNTKTSNKLYKFYSTFLHELQHLNHFYNRNIKQYPGDNIWKQRTLGSDWFNEFIAILTEHVFLYAILDKLNITQNDEKLNYAYSKGIRQGYFQFNHTLFKHPLLKSDKLSPKIYDLHQIFSAYILANYGADVISNLMHNNSDTDFKIDGTALFDAISENAYNETFYGDYAKRNRPQSFDEVINDFYTANLLSEIPFPLSDGPSSPWITSGPVKMYVYSDSNLRNAGILNGNESAMIASNLPIKNTDLKSIFGDTYKFVTYNLSFSPVSFLRSSTYYHIAKNDPDIDFTRFWLSSAGAILSSKNTINQSRAGISGNIQQGLGTYLYLGGKSAKNNDISKTSFTTLPDKTLTLDVKIPPGTATTLVILE